MTRWVAVPQRMNNPPQVSFVVPMTPEAAKAQLMYMESVNRVPNILAAKEAAKEAYKNSALPNFFRDVMDKTKDAKDSYLMGESITYIIIAIVIIMMLLFVQ
ncbi:MAG: hypothetical protein ACRDAQ_00815 [Cetobacterium sp.]